MVHICKNETNILYMKTRQRKTNSDQCV